MLFLDFETRSTCDLKKVGVYAYAHHPDTRIACTGWAVDDGEVDVIPGWPAEIERYLLDPNTIIVAHNAQMEREMLDAAGYPLPWSRFVDTAALSARMSLPRKLEAVALALKLEEQKDTAGHRVMMKLARPRGGWGDDEFWEEEDRPEDFESLRAYCRQDVVVMREIYRRLLPLSPTEAQLYALTGKMNDAGVRVDITSIADALTVLDEATREELAEFKTLTGGATPKSYPRVAKVFGLSNVRKVTVRRALKNGYSEKTAPDGAVQQVPLTPAAKRGLYLFQRLARSSPAKLRAMTNRASKDGRVRGVLIYSGAERTQRWSSGGIQAHNFPRGLGEGTETAFEALAAGCLELVYDDVTGTIAEMMRGFLVGPFLVGDFAQIEARCLNWFAGQADMVEVFAKKGDPYCLMASKIYGRSITKKSEDPKLPPGITPRFIGKQVVLGAGYGLGWAKFQRAMDEVFDIQLDTDFCMRVIATYRESSPAVCAWWRRLEQGFTYVVERNTARLQVDKRIAMGNVEVGGLRYTYIELPSARRLYYAEPEMTSDGVRYWGRNIYKGGAWDRVTTYGGKLAENIVQATSRDILAHSMLELDKAGFPLVLQVHDEVVAEADGKHLLSSLKDIMLKTPCWADGLPVDVEVFESQRYRK